MNENALENLAIDFREFLMLYKFINRPKLIQILTNELSDPQKTSIYELSDGINSARDISGKVKTVSHATVVNYWKRWAQLGIAVPAERKGRYKAVFNLAEYGLSIISSTDENE